MPEPARMGRRLHGLCRLMPMSVVVGMFAFQTSTGRIVSFEELSRTGSCVGAVSLDGNHGCG